MTNPLAVVEEYQALAREHESAAKANADKALRLVVAEEIAREIEKQRDDCAKVWSGRRATYTFCAIIARQVGAR